MNQNNNKIISIGWFLYDKGAKMACFHRRDGNTTNSPNTWDCFGGAIEDSETITEALERELKEELNIEVQGKDMEFIYEKNNQATYCIHFPISKTKTIKLRPLKNPEYRLPVSMGING